uniref:Uncharacterized protein n=1 Tax=Gouania willdenowi TaxID=441366 RepID=A0A8C5DC84_GOUWI
KHEYEVKNVVKLKNSSWKKVFVSGDKLMQINGKDLRDVTPEEVAEMLAEGNPMLQVKPGEEAPPCKETLQPFSKEYTTLTFEWKMIRGEQSEVCQQEKEKEEEEEAETELEYKEEERMEEKDLLVIKMTKTSISLVRGRGCDVNSPCQGCNGSGCVFNDIVVVAESSQVTLERITIYSYMSISTDCPYRGVPGGAEPHWVPTAFSMITPNSVFVVYMKGRTVSFFGGHRTFESALHKDRFIHIVNSEAVQVGRLDGQLDEESFFFVIQK